MNGSKLLLKEKPTLRDFQKYVAQMVRERGFHQETIAETFMLFVEECGELAKEIRKRENVKTDPMSNQTNLPHELADIFIYLLDLSNQFGIDLEKAFRDKEEINKKRVWQ